MTRRIHSIMLQRPFGVAEVELGRGIVYTKEGKYNDAMSKIESSLPLRRNSTPVSLKSSVSINCQRFGR
jgi:hypothetical protein